METNNVTPAPITQTLFQLVSLRSPQLSTDSDKKIIFVERSYSDSVFDTAISNKPTTISKRKALLDEAINFSELENNYFIDHNSKLYDFSVYVQKNKAVITKEDLFAKAIDTDSIPVEFLKEIWENLMYQVITQKSFYTKETLMQLLQANHIVQYCKQLNSVEDLSAETMAKILNATVVLPKELFLEDEQTVQENTIQAPNAKATVANKFMQSAQAVLKAKQQIVDLETLKSEFQKFELQYNSDNDANFQTEKDNHQTAVNSLIETYKNEVASANETWKNNNDINNYNKENPFLQPETIAYPELPVLNYMPLPIFENYSLYNILSTNAVATFCKTFNYEISNARGHLHLVDLPSAKKFTSFAIAYQIINEAIQLQQATIMANSKTGTAQLNLGGVIIDDVNSNFRNVLEFQLCPKPVDANLVNFDLGFSIPDASWEIQNVNYTVQNNNGFTISDTYFDAVKNGNTILLANLCNQGISNSQQPLSINGTMFFTNGVQLSFSVNDMEFNLCYTGMFVMELDQTSTDVLPTQPFIPSGFGYKQIGIADYKKVEQTVHCYVEGEVAHIENIMAREYKEKATRRLRRSENTSTTSSESEKEQQTDTSSTSRYEMQSEVAKVLQESKDFSANASFGVSFGGKLGSVQLSAGANYATHNSKEESTRQAITEAKEITEKALNRLVTKVKEERVVKIVDEYEENNKHGFDNREGDKHVNGVYRWVDKIMKNRIVNFGKRLMFEFMIPQPAKLHSLGIKNNLGATTLIMPQDPRNQNNPFAISDITQLTETTAKYWAAKYEAEIEALPADEIVIGHSFDSFSKESDNGSSKATSIEIPENYYTTKAAVNFTGMASGGNSGWDRKVLVSVGNKSFLSSPTRIDERNYLPIDAFTKTVPASFSVTNYHTATATISIGCKLTEQAKKQWQQITYNSIMEAYNTQLGDYLNKLDVEKSKAAKAIDVNPNFYRQIENTILRKNCIAYLVDNNANATKTYGLQMHNNSNSFNSYAVNANAQLDQYTAFAKFLEQAFEWDVMSYNLYPFYWANKQEWATLYQTDNADPLFRSFLQSGMARVVVTVRPGFEAAVQHYISTGQIWTGGQVPVIGDALYLSLTDELKQPTGQPEGKAWISRIPTTLTIIQANSIGLEVIKALPCNCNDTADFENPALVPCGDSIVLTTNTLVASTNG